MYPNILYLDPITVIYFVGSPVTLRLVPIFRSCQSTFRHLRPRLSEEDLLSKVKWKICPIIDYHCQLTSISPYFISCSSHFSHVHLIFSPLCLSQLQDCKRFIRFAPLGCGTDMIEELQDGPLPLISRGPQLHSRGDIPVIKPIIGV